MTDKLDHTLNDFMSLTGKSRVAVVVPLYGYWADVPNNPVNGELLKAVLNRLYSLNNQLYVVFVANPETMPSDATDPYSVMNILTAQAHKGNTVLLPIERTASYPEYVQKGWEYALDETQAQFLMVFNPWVIVQEGAIDVIVDRCNRADEAKVVSGFDVRLLVDSKGFDKYIKYAPNILEEIDLTFAFMAMPRMMAEMLTLDLTYKTHRFFERDIWQQVLQKSFAPITTQKVPIFICEFPWTDYEKQKDFEADRLRFLSKWIFDPGIAYFDTEGIARQDKAGAQYIQS